MASLHEIMNGADPVRAARTSSQGSVVITTPMRHWPFMRGPREERETDRSGCWLRVAMTALAILAASAAVVSYQAQYRMVAAYKHAPAIAALQAGIPDLAALVFASLGIALALHGRRAIQARLLNVTAVCTSIYMNAIAASSGWKALSVWMLAPVTYAVASDTLIGVVRAWTLARQREPGRQLPGDEATPLAAAGQIVLYAARFAVAPKSTASGMRHWLLLNTPLPASAQPMVSAMPSVPAIGAVPGPRRSSKTSQFLSLVITERGPLAQFPVCDVSRAAAELASRVGLDAGAARTALRKAVLAAQKRSGS